MKHGTKLAELARKAQLVSLRRKNLEQCEKHVVLGEKHVLRQREIVDKLDRSGLDTGWALNTFERLQLLPIEHRDYFRDGLAAIASRP